MPAQAWVTLIVGLIATVGVLVTWRQKNTADRRSEWWRRTTWALELTFSDAQEQRRLGWSLLLALAASKLVTKGDSDILQAIAEHVAMEGGGDDGEDSRDDVLADPHHDGEPDEYEQEGPGQQLGST
ncbi:hypothetical protein [Mycolicibacterium chlorophenolicum]|uniref:Uncharacterized protein n=1 Tax=Mycolicibacterium chlorophenolicum TaxID=37916 RepID=A0A0J6VK36_9MYCO|nr:hypothetical protein [Mycolicibacterium chlorophenolicum]KMO69818.1 hypothetical protein MCHLDSM_05930 [Mycolicibacterium chlorophenolicum]